MIEVEKKFSLGEKERKTIEKQAHFLQKSSFQDIYYDTSDFCLTKKNLWLRKRGETLELKVGLSKRNGSFSQFIEIEEEEKIFEYLKIPYQGNAKKALEKASILPFGSFKTIRRKYQYESFFIFIDRVDFGDFAFSIIEIERLVERQEGIKKIEEEILQLAKKLGLDTTLVLPSKMMLYLSRKRPDHYQALVQAGVIDLEDY